MLTADLLVAATRGGQVVPRYVPLEGDEAIPWLARAGELIELFTSHVGRRRGQLDDALADRVAGRTDFRVDRGLAKLLADRAQFRGLSGDEAAALRRRVFVAAAQARAAGAFERDAVLEALGEGPPRAVLRDLYGDLKENETLEAAWGVTPRELLERYNLALAQAVLLRARELDVEVRRADPPRLRQLVRHVRFHGLLQEARRDADGCVRLRLDGPLSIFGATPRYGVRMAGFLPALLLCEDWRLEASVQLAKGGRRRRFELTPEAGLVSPRADTGAWLPELVEGFPARFSEAAPEWSVDREVELLSLGGEVVVPDFRFVHGASGWTGYLEVLGYWRRGGVERRLEVLRTHEAPNLILALDQRLRLGKQGARGLSAAVVPFRDVPSSRKVRAALEALRAGDQAV